MNKACSDPLAKPELPAMNLRIKEEGIEVLNSLTDRINDLMEMVQSFNFSLEVPSEDQIFKDKYSNSDKLPPVIPTNPLQGSLIDTLRAKMNAMEEELLEKLILFSDDVGKLFLYASLPSFRNKLRSDRMINTKASLSIIKEVIIKELKLWEDNRLYRSDLVMLANQKTLEICDYRFMVSYKTTLEALIHQYIELLDIKSSLERGEDIDSSCLQGYFS